MSGLPALYADPALYDLIHDEGADDEAWLLDLLAARHGNRGKSALEPACGTGRCLEGLLRRGWRVLGYDLSPGMAAFARERLSRWKGRARILKGDMTSFRPAATFDLAFNLLSTFRHLMSDRDALAHLRVTADALNPGGIFILGLDLAAYGLDEPEEETWTARRGGRVVLHVMETLPPDPVSRRERVINFVTAPKGRGKMILESAYDLRSYDAAELSRLIARSPFAIEACYGYDGRPAALGGPERALWLVLRVKPGARPRRRAGEAGTSRVSRRPHRWRGPRASAGG